MRILSTLLIVLPLLLMARLGTALGAGPTLVADSMELCLSEEGGLRTITIDGKIILESSPTAASGIFLTDYRAKATRRVAGTWKQVADGWMLDESNQRTNGGPVVRATVRRVGDRITWRGAVHDASQWSEESTLSFAWLLAI